MMISAVGVVDKIPGGNSDFALLGLGKPYDGVPVTACPEESFLAFGNGGRGKQ